jgi:hypothetical protein
MEAHASSQQKAYAFSDVAVLLEGFFEKLVGCAVFEIAV